MAIIDDEDVDFDPQLGEVPAGLEADLYSKHLDNLRKEEDFGEAVLSFRDDSGSEQEFPLDEVAGTEHDAGSNRTKVLLRNGAVIVATGAVIAGAIATIRYRRKHRS